MGMDKQDRIDYTDDYLSLVDENGEETEFHMVARVTLRGRDYLVLEEPEDEESLIIFGCETDEDGFENYTALESEEESEEVFYLFEACYDDYEVGNAI